MYMYIFMCMFMVRFSLASKNLHTTSPVIIPSPSSSRWCLRGCLPLPAAQI